MDPSSTCVHSPKLTVCPYLCLSGRSQKAWRFPLFFQDLKTWGALGHPAVLPSATGPGGKKKRVLVLNMLFLDYVKLFQKRLSSRSFPSVITCAGVRSQFFATSITKGSVTSFPFPKEEKAWKHTPYSSQTLLSSVWHSRG